MTKTQTFLIDAGKSTRTVDLSKNYGEIAILREALINSAIPYIQKRLPQLEEIVVSSTLLIDQKDNIQLRGKILFDDKNDYFGAQFDYDDLFNVMISYFTSERAEERLSVSEVLADYIADFIEEAIEKNKNNQIKQ